MHQVKLQVVHVCSKKIGTLGKEDHWRLVYINLYVTPNSIR